MMPIFRLAWLQSATVTGPKDGALRRYALSHVVERAVSHEPGEVALVSLRVSYLLQEPLDVALVEVHQDPEEHVVRVHVTVERKRHSLRPADLYRFIPGDELRVAQGLVGISVGKPEVLLLHLRDQAILVAGQLHLHKYRERRLSRVLAGASRPVPPPACPRPGLGT